MPHTYGARHPEVRALRSLARDPHARRDSAACLLEGPRVIAAALDRGAHLSDAYFGEGATRAFSGLAERLARAGVPVHGLKEGGLERVSTTRAPQPVLAVARFETRTVAELVDAARTASVIVALDIADPGNLGTILRSVEASGAAGVVVGGSSVDVRNPKVVRASAGALFGIPVAEEPDGLAAIGAFGAAGARVYAATARSGADPAAVHLARECAIVVGNEARGVDERILSRCDGAISVPMSGVAESLNVAMAATVLCFESARQRRPRPEERGR